MISFDFDMMSLKYEFKDFIVESFFIQGYSVFFFFFQVHIDINKISQEFVEIQTLFSLSRMNFLIFFFSSFLFSRRKVVI